MYGYMPERIYELVKSDSDFKTISDFLTIYKESCMKNFKDFIESDANMNVADKEKYSNMFMKLIRRCALNYYTEMCVIFNNYDKQTLLTMYKDDSYDSETKLIILSHIINESYIDHDSIIDYMKEYIYEYDLAQDKASLSSYVHLKYLHSSLYVYANTVSIVTFSSEYVDDAVKYCKDKLAYCGQYVSSKDNLYNDFIQCLNDMVNALCSRTPDSFVFDFVEAIYPTVEELSYQYEKYSYSYIKFMDHRFNLYFSARDFDTAFSILKNNVEYMDNALADLPTLFRALSFYDKCAHASFIVIVRKYIKICKSIKALNNIDFKNLLEDDRNLALSEDITEEGTSPNRAYYYIIKNYTQHVDDWIKNNNDMFVILNS